MMGLVFWSHTQYSRGCAAAERGGLAMAELSEQKLLLVIIAILLPPLAVGLKEGVGGQLILNIVLWLCFLLPGILHAVWIVLR